ncbi:MAG: phosphatidic acid phosphatase [Clostridia bacterium]|nr:phosphatidic acid phosphatase [Clostridia bacterium]
MVNYRTFRLSKLNTPEFEHVKLLLFWPLFGIAFMLLERVFITDYHVIECAVDDKIPFCEFFVIPYYFWFVFLIGIQIYSFFFDIPTFKKYMKYTIITYTVTLAIYIIYPTSQELRPTSFERQNIFTEIVKFLYGFDTNTNVCPSLHVIGSMAVYFAARKSKLFSSFGWRAAFCITALLISVSTVFLKQHSVLDIFYAFVVCAAAYPFVFMKEAVKGTEKASKKTEQYI